MPTTAPSSGRSFFRSSRSLRTRGSVIPLLAVVMVVLMGALAYVVDVGDVSFERARLQHTSDAAALAGGMELPSPARDATYGNKATKVALDYVRLNDPKTVLTVGDVSFRCVVADANKDGKPDTGELAGSCPQVSAGSTTCKDGLCIAPCSLASSSAKCNSIVIDGHKDVPFVFAPVLGLTGARTVSARSTACAGACGGTPSQPLDVGLIIDRTPSMSDSDLANAKNAALAVLKTYDPAKQHVALAVLGAADPSDLCGDKEPDEGGTWLAVPLSSDYRNPDGSLNGGSRLVSTISCLRHSSSSQATNLGSPLRDLAFGRPDMLTHLENAGRSGVKKGIIFVTDGAANQPKSVPGYSQYSDKPCAYARKMADDTKAAGIELFTIGFGIENEECSDGTGKYSTSSPAATVLADMATDSQDDHGSCANQGAFDGENADGDHLLCEPRTDDLSIVFKQAAVTLAGGVRLLPSLTD